MAIQRAPVMVLLGALAIVSIFVAPNYVLHKGTYYNMDIKITLVDVDKVAGGYSCKVKAEVTNNNDFHIDNILLNLTILTEDGQRYFSREETLKRLELGGTWTKIFTVIVTEDPGEYVTLLLKGHYQVNGDFKTFDEKERVKVEL